MQTVSKKSWDDGQDTTNIQQSRNNTRKLLLISSSADWYTPYFQLFTILAQDKPPGWNFSSFFLVSVWIFFLIKTFSYRKNNYFFKMEELKIGSVADVESSCHLGFFFYYLMSFGLTTSVPRFMFIYIAFHRAICLLL